MSMGSGGTVTMQVKALGITEFVAEMGKITSTLENVNTKVNSLVATAGKTLGTALPAGFQQMGQSADLASQKTLTFTERMTGFQGNLLTAATSTGTFTASIFGIDQAMDNLTRTELALEQARVRQNRMQTTLQAAEQRLYELRNSGTASASDIAIAEDRVTTARQALEVQTEKVDFMQQNYSEDMAQFGAQILPQVITATLSGVTAFQSIFALIGKSDSAMKFLNTGWDKFKVTMTSIVPPMTQTNGAITTTTSSLGLLGTALGVAGLTVGTLIVGMTLFANNTGGARDAVNQWGIDLGKRIPEIKGLLDAIGQLGVVITETFNPSTRFTMDFINVGLQEIRTRSIPTIEDLKNAIDSLIVPATGAGTAMLAMSGKVQNASILLLDLDTQTKMLQQTLTKMDPNVDVTPIFKDFSNDLLGFMDVVRQVPSLEPLISQTLTAWNDKLADGMVNVNEFANLLNTEVVQLISQSATAISAELDRMTLSSTDAFQKMVNDIDTQIAPALAAAMIELRRLLAQGIGGEGDPLGKVMAFTGVEQNIQKVITAMTPLIKKTKETADTTKEYAQIALPMYIKAMGLSGGVTDENTKAVVKNATELLKSAKVPDVMKVALTGLVDTYGDANDKSIAFTASLSEEEKGYIALAKSVYGLTIENQNQLEAAKPQLESAKARIDAARDEFNAVRDNAIQYGVSAEALNAFSVETDYSAESIKQKTLAVIELTTEQIKWNEITDGSTESLIKLAQATQDGVVQFKDFYEQLVLGEKQTEAYGKALTANVMDILKEMPDAIGKVASEFETLLPNTMKSFEAFQGTISPFDKDALKEYTQQLKDWDVPKELRDKIKDAWKIGQDKAEVQQEWDGMAAGLTGIIAHNFEELDTETVFGFLDEFEGRLGEMQDLGMPPEIAANIQGIITEIRNSEDPIGTLLKNWETLNGAMDSDAIDKVTIGMHTFGQTTQMLVQNGSLAAIYVDSENIGTAFERIAGSGAPEALAAYVKAAEAWNASVGKNMQKGENLLMNEAEANAIKQGLVPATGAQAVDDKGAAALSKAWTDAQTVVLNASTLIQQSITGMHNVVNTLLLLEIQGVLNTQTAWSTFSTSLNTYGISMSTNFAASQAAINTSLLLMIEGVTNTQTAWSTFSTSLATYSTSMTTNYGAAQQAINTSLLLQIEGVTNTQTSWSEFSTSLATYSKSMSDNYDAAQKAINTSLLLQIEGVENTDKAWLDFQENLKTYADTMVSDLETWEGEVKKNMDNAVTDFGKAKDAVGELQSAIDALKSKTVTIKVEIEKTGGGGGDLKSAQHGGAEILSGSKYVFAGEGHKPELHLFYPLDQMSQSHTNSQFTLPFNMGDLTAPKVSAANIVASGGGPQPVIPTNLVSNVRMNANLHIDLSDEIKKVVRKEINAIAVGRLDRMAM